MDKYDYDKLFLKQARLGYSNLLHRHHDKSPDSILRQRKHLIDKDFVFTEANIKQFSVLNSLLAEKGEAAYEHAEKLEREIVSLMKKPDSFIMDYEIEFELSFFAEKKYSHIPELEGNPFFECKPIMYHKLIDMKQKGESENHKDWLFKTDHRETFHEDHSLSGFPHCYLFHDLIDHSILSYQDLFDIEDIWIDVVLTIQNHITLEKTQD